MIGLTRRSGMIALLLAAVAGGSARAAGPADYLAAVRAYADTLLKAGRDCYGKVTSPLIAAALDRKTLKLPKAGSIAGIRGGDRVLTGANPMHDQGLYQVLYALSAVTGEKRYAAEADRTLKWFFEHCQGPATGLMAWGEHMGWDFNRESPAGRNTHEFFRPWVLWDRVYALSPKPCEAFARGLWDHQIHNKTTGEFSRHARWDKHGTGTRNEYPRHGGFCIATWAAAYRRTKNPVYAQAVTSLLDLYKRLSNPETGAILCSSNPARATIVWPESNVSLAVDLWDSAAVMPADLGRRMRARASKTDDVYLKLTHDFGPKGIGFVAGAHWGTLAALTSGSWTHTQMYATSYGKSTDAQVAMLCTLRYRQVKLPGYRKLVLAAAGRYLTTDPDTKGTVFPGAMGDVIFLMIAAGELTGEAGYLDRADHFARMAMRLFLADSPLPRASTRNGHYEAITRADTLMMALLKLWQVRTRPRLKLNMVYSDR